VHAHAHVHTIKYLILIAFPQQQWFANAPKYYVIRTLRVLLWHSNRQHVNTQWSAYEGVWLMSVIQLRVLQVQSQDSWTLQPVLKSLYRLSYLGSCPAIKRLGITLNVITNIGYRERQQNWINYPQPVSVVINNVHFVFFCVLVFGAFLFTKYIGDPTNAQFY
jgi:hypothetical protein